MEILFVCAYTIFVTHDLIDSWKVLLETKRKIFHYVGLIVTVLLFVYIAFDVIPIIRVNNLQGSFRGWYDLGYVLLTSYSVYDFGIWMIMSFSQAREGKETTKLVDYNLWHAGSLLVGTCVACYLTILVNYYLFPPVGVSLIDIFWILIYFISFIVGMIRMIWGEAMNFKNLVRIVFNCVMGFQLLFYIMFLIDNLNRLTNNFH
ncbi:hypothetical protein [Dyadobacter frigoris]|uniref:Uncharacterized protein n=1 Tax=Dyadobacter frigoris TaxID=2576211 RepID=A0A4U6D619_9BACT|nr:hypothetical protein [Dyadobacter frigoris]TKT91657.1 hypothetical protein FDK13_14935 [Dyadobacter frigoris]GLU51779.1 hypothetical protein Dfri01_12400 [Dyadobacter frigoris]